MKRVCKNPHEINNSHEQIAFSRSARSRRRHCSSLRQIYSLIPQAFPEYLPYGKQYTGCCGHKD